MNHPPRNIDLTTDDTYIIFLPFFHVNAQSWSFFSVLGVGATAVLMPINWRLAAPEVRALADQAATLADDVDALAAQARKSWRA